MTDSILTARRPTPDSGSPMPLPHVADPLWRIRGQIRTRRLFTIPEASERVGLTPITVQNYCLRRPYLERDRDFVVIRWRHGTWRRHKLFITEAGLLRLLTRPWVHRYATKRKDRPS